MAKKRKVKRSKTKIRTITKNVPVIVQPSLSLRKRKRRVKSVRKMRKTRTRTRTRSKSLIKRFPSGTIEMVKTAALTGVGAIGGSMIANKAPVPENLKPVIPVLAGLGLLMVTKGNKDFAPICTGAILASLLSIAKKVNPNVSLAGTNIGLPITLQGTNLGIPVSSEIVASNPIEELLISR